MDVGLGNTWRIKNRNIKGSINKNIQVRWVSKLLPETRNKKRDKRVESGELFLFFFRVDNAGQVAKVFATHEAAWAREHAASQTHGF